MNSYLTFTWILVLIMFSLEAYAEMKGDGGIYTPVGKRDPFKELSVENLDRPVASLRPLEKYSLDQLELKAIIHGGGPARAMFRDPKGKVHIVAEGSLIGRERAVISRILNKEVIVTERTTNYLGQESLFERVLSLPVDKSLGTLDVENGNSESKNSEVLDKSSVNGLENK